MGVDLDEVGVNDCQYLLSEFFSYQNIYFIKPTRSAFSLKILDFFENCALFLKMLHLFLMGHFFIFF